MPVSPLPEGVSLVDVLAELAVLRRIVVEQADLIAAATPAGEGFLNVVASAVLGCAVG